VALNRLTEVRIDQNMPGEGKRKGSTTMGGVRWEWEEEVIELPYEGMFRIDVRSHSTGELVDDTRPEQKTSSQALSPSTASGSSTANVAWTSTVSGVISSSRSDLRQPVAVSWSIDPSGGNPQQPGGSTNPPPKTAAPSN